MALTSAQIAKQTEVLVGVRAAFNAAVVPVAAALNALPQNDVLTSAIAAWNNIVNVMNAGNTAAIRAALDATAVMVPSDPPVVTTTPLFANDLSSVALIQRDFIHASAFYGTLPTINNPSVWIDGMLEVPIQVPLNSGPGIGGTGFSWHHALQVANELWLEYDFMVTLDVAAGMNENGIKLPGLCGGLDTAADGTWFSARMWHGRRFPDGRYPLAAYIYSAQQHETMESGGFGDIVLSTGWLTEGKRHKIGQHIKLNTPGVADGVLEMLLDGVSVYRDAKYKFRTNGVQIDDLFFNIFHGGTLPVTNRITFRVANVVVDNKPIPWKPPVIIDTGPKVPAWRKDAPIGKFIDIPGSSPASLGNLGTLLDGDYSGVYNDRTNGWIYSAAASGHAVGAQNGVYGINLMADAPRWTTLRASSGDSTPGLSDTYWPDGRPAGSHLYYCGQVPIIGGKPVLVRTVGLSTNYSNNPTAQQRTDAFHIDRNDWDLNGGDWDVPTPRAAPGENAIALDRRSNKIYRMDQNGLLAVLDCVTRKWKTINTDVFYGWGGCVVVPDLDELLWDAGNYNGRGGLYLMGYNVTTGAMTQRNYTWEGTPKPSAAQWRSMLVQERNSAIYVLGDVGQLCRLDLKTWKMKQVDTVPMPITPYNRIEDFPTLGGIVHFPAFGSNLRFCATE